MPPSRSPKKTWGKSAAPYKKNSFVPSDETLDGEADEEYRSRAESDPYTHYVLKTGKHREKTLKKIHEEGDPGYIRLMLTNPKACKDSDDDHIVKKGLLHWLSAIEGTVIASPSTTDTTAASKTSAASTDLEATRFRDSQ